MMIRPAPKKAEKKPSKSTRKSEYRGAGVYPPVWEHAAACAQRGVLFRT